MTSHGIGVVVLDENGEQMNSVILPKNVQVPAEKKNYYQTAIPYQESLSLEVTQGVSNLSEEEVKQNAARISKLDISGE